MVHEAVTRALSELISLTSTYDHPKEPEVTCEEEVVVGGQRLEASFLGLRSFSSLYGIFTWLQCMIIDSIVAIHDNGMSYRH